MDADDDLPDDFEVPAHITIVEPEFGANSDEWGNNYD
jgi:hypothetical protein